MAEAAPRSAGPVVGDRPCAPAIRGDVLVVGEPSDRRTYALDDANVTHPAAIR